MKKTFFVGCLFLGLMSSMTSCKKNDDGGGGSASDSLDVSLSKSSVEFNGFDYAIITVKDGGNDITSTAEIYANGTAIGSRFVASGTGTYNITAKKGGKASPIKTLNVTAAAASPFTQKIIVEDMTGAWCGYCPRIANSLDVYKASHPNCIVVGIHGGGTDPYKYQYYTSFNSAFGITGYPTAITNRKKKWGETSSELNAELTKWAPLGIAIESSVSAATITGKLKVKFNVTTDQPMKVVIALVENGLVSNQTNYYAPTYGGNPIVGFVHNAVLRKAATDIFGDAIPVTSQTKDNVWELPFSMSLTGTTSDGINYTANAAKCAIVAYVLDGSTAKKGTYNVQYATVGTTKNFD